MNRDRNGDGGRRNGGKAGGGARPARSRGAALWLSALPLALAACLGPDDKDPGVLPDASYVFAITVSDDYQTGSYSAYGLESGTILPDLEANHADAAVRFRGGSDIFVINRMGRDNLLVVDRNNLKVVMTVKFPALSNPYDIEARDGLIYAAFFAYDSILIYDQSNGNRAGAIDIHAYADEDGFAEIAALRFAGGYLYAVAQNLDTRDPMFKPHADPKLLKIDVKKREVVEAITLPLANPLDIAYEDGKLFLPCVGEYGIPDGGIVELDPASGEARVLAKEEDFGGDIGSLAVHGNKLIFTVHASEDDLVLAFAAVDKSLDTVATLPAWGAKALAADAESNTLCLADAAEGLRLFRLDTFAEKDTTNIDLGLAPVDLAIIR